MNSLNVALLQIYPHGSNLDQNLAKGLEYCYKAKEMNADIVLFPEMWSIGYKLNSDGAEQEHLAIEIDSPFLDAFRKVAAELEMAIAITYLQKWEPKPRNVVSLIDRHGNIVMTYAKVHTCDFRFEEVNLTPGDDFYVAALDTQLGPVNIGLMICMEILGTG